MSATPLPLSNFDDLLAERRIDLCHQTVRLWWNRFRPTFAAEIGRKRVDSMWSCTHWRRRLDEIQAKISGEMRCLWPTFKHKREVLETFARKQGDKAKATKFIKPAMKIHYQPRVIAIHGLRSSRTAMQEIGNLSRQYIGWANNRAEN
jgi:putative transposase